jgi:hypothetical protein
MNIYVVSDRKVIYTPFQSVKKFWTMKEIELRII